MRIVDLNEKLSRKSQIIPPKIVITKPFITFSPKKKRPVLFKVIIIIVIVSLGALLWKANTIGSKIFGSHVPFFQQASNLVTGNQAAAKLQGEDQGQINILLLGYGGVGHDGPYLTDSIILASIRPADKKVLLTSIPRDTYFLSSQGEKINAAFPGGFHTNSQNITTQNIESGGAAAEAAVATLSGETIPYFASIDFQGFVEAVKRVGGLQINVQNSFTDNEYPNGDANANGPVCTATQGNTSSKCRYIKVHFDAGLQTMDGETALQYTRSRHASGSEGSDFARSKRQQLVLEAFKSKVESLNLLTNATAVNDVLNILADHLHTNMTLAQASHLVQILHQPGMQIVSQSLDPSTDLVCNAILPTDGAFVVKPCDGVTDTQIAQFFQNGYEISPLKAEAATVIMENAGVSSTVYSKIKKGLTDSGATVYEARYHDNPTSQNIVYAVNSKPATLAYLEKELGVTAQPLPTTKTAKADLVVVIASDVNTMNGARQ